MAPVNCLGRHSLSHPPVLWFSLSATLPLSRDCSFSPGLEKRFHTVIGHHMFYSLPHSHNTLVTLLFIPLSFLCSYTDLFITGLEQRFHSVDGAG